MTKLTGAAPKPKNENEPPLTFPASPTESYLQGSEAFDIRHNARVDLHDFAVFMTLRASE